MYEKLFKLVGKMCSRVKDYDGTDLFMDAWHVTGFSTRDEKVFGVLTQALSPLNDVPCKGNREKPERFTTVTLSLSFVKKNLPLFIKFVESTGCDSIKIKIGDNYPVRFISGDGQHTFWISPRCDIDEEDE